MIFRIFVDILENANKWKSFENVILCKLASNLCFYRILLLLHFSLTSARCHIHNMFCEWILKTFINFKLEFFFFCSVTQLCPTLCDPWTAACQASLSFTISWSLFKLMSIESVMPSNYLILCHPLLLPPSIFPSIRIFTKWVSSSHQVAKILELQHQSFQWLSRVDILEDWLVWSACSPTDSQESSPTPQFKRTNSSALSLLYSSTFTCIYGYWKNHSFDYTDLCQQSDVFAF